MNNKEQAQTPASEQTPAPSMSMSEILKAEKAEMKAKKKAEKLRKKGIVVTDSSGKVVPDLNKKHVRGIESMKSWYGFFFILPWLIGMVLFFIIPLIQSIIYSFCEVIPEEGGMSLSYVGLENFRYIFQEDPDFVKNLSSSISSFFTTMPIVVILSLILAIVLNGNFKGRVFFRAIFFVPVIVATGVVMSLLSRNYGGYGAIIQLTAKTTEEAYSAVGAGGGMDFTTLLNSLKLPEDLTTQLSNMITNIFNTIWTCGIPVILFIAGLQTIPAQLYEASKVEGATSWEEFWYITLPMISQTLLLVIVFTLIEILTQANNKVITAAYYQMISNTNYNVSAAMLWAFFAIIGAAMALIIGLYSKLCLKRWE